MRPSLAISAAVLAGAIATLGSPAAASSTGTIDVTVEAPGASGGSRPGASAPPPDATQTGGWAGGLASGPTVADLQAFCDAIGQAENTVGGCIAGAPQDGDGAGPTPPAITPEILAQAVRDEVAIAVPRPGTSPAGPQVTGLRTWFWLDRSAWRPVTARAELPGLWAEVTATPVRATWTPGDGSPPVTCEGPGRPHPGTAGATTTCGHTYTRTGAHTLRVAVTYAVTWRSSTGASGTQDPIVLGTTAPVTVEQRQVVVT